MGKSSQICSLGQRCRKEISYPSNMGAGHGGVSGRFRRYKETAMEYAFIFDLLGIEE